MAGPLAAEAMKVDFELIDLDVDLAQGLVNYEEGLIKALKLEDQILKAAVELAVDLKKQLQSL